jgi:inorganic pyrophosphatase
MCADQHFFSVYKDLEEKKVGIEGWEDKASAIQTIKESQKRYWDNYNALGTSKV